jgi:hypothetical protein
MGVEESVDQVKVARAAAAGAGREFPPELTLGASCKRASLFVAYMNPLNFAIQA